MSRKIEESFSAPLLSETENTGKFWLRARLAMRRAELRELGWRDVVVALGLDPESTTDVAKVRNAATQIEKGPASSQPDIAATFASQIALAKWTIHKFPDSVKPPKRSTARAAREFVADENF